MASFKGIPGSESWQRVEKIDKGWSSDEKYEVLDSAGRRLALRLSDGSRFESKKAEFERVGLVSGLPFAVSRAVDFGLTADDMHVYQLLTWVEGEPLEERIDFLTSQAQYECGRQAGDFLRQIHELPTRACSDEWEERMAEKMLTRVKLYEECGHRIEGDEAAIAFVRTNLGLLQNVRKVCQHGDYHIGNLILTPSGQIGVIDFNRSDWGDYVEEFYKVQAFDRERSIPFAQGKIDGYFAAAPPGEFWRRLALYVAYSSLYSIVWAIPYGPEDVEGMRERCRLALEDYDGFRRLVPRWYEG